MAHRTRLRLPRFVTAGLLGSGIFTGAWLATGAGAGRAQVEEAAAAVVAQNPFTDLERPRSGEERLVGRVLELRPAGPYTYASIEVGAGPERRARWVVMLRAGAIARGDRVTVKSFGTRRDFRSRRLGMTFDELVFGVVRPVREGEEGSR